MTADIRTTRLGIDALACHIGAVRRGGADRLRIRLFLPGTASRHVGMPDAPNRGVQMSKRMARTSLAGMDASHMKCMTAGGARRPIREAAHEPDDRPDAKEAR